MSAFSNPVVGYLLPAVIILFFLLFSLGNLWSQESIALAVYLGTGVVSSSNRLSITWLLLTSILYLYTSVNSSLLFHYQSVISLWLSFSWSYLSLGIIFSLGFCKEKHLLVIYWNLLFVSSFPFPGHHLPWPGHQTPAVIVWPLTGV